MLRASQLIVFLTLLLLLLFWNQVSAQPIEAIAFALTQNGVSSIYLVQPDGTNLRLVIRNGIDPSFAPGGRQIIFARGHSIFTVNRDGTGLTPLKRHTPGNRVNHPQISEDRTIVVFNSTPNRPGAITSIRLFRTDNSEERIIAPAGLDPSFSPDQSGIIYTHSGAIYRVSRRAVADTSYTPALLRTIGDNVIVRHAKAGPGMFDGIIYAVRPNRENSVWNINALLFGQESPRNVVLATNAGQPAFSPDGRRIVFVRNGDLYVMNADGTGQKRILDAQGAASHPSWWMPGRF